MTALKKYKRIKAKPNELLMAYGKEPGENPGICYAWFSESGKRDASFIHYYLTTKKPDPVHGYKKMLPSFLEELEQRGYDITTFKMSVMKK